MNNPPQIPLNDSTVLGALIAGMRMKLPVPHPENAGETVLVDAIPWQETEEGIVILIQLPAYAHFLTNAYQLEKQVIQVPGVPAPYDRAVRVYLKKPDTSRIIRPEGATIPPGLRRLMNGNG